MSKRGRARTAPALHHRGVVERARSYLIVGTCFVVALLIIGAAAWAPASAKVRASIYRGQALADVGDSPSGAGCRAPYKLAVTGTPSQTTEGAGQFVSATPAYGPYSADSSNTTGTTTGAAFYDTTTRPALSDLVGAEYAGYTIVWYDDTISGAKLAQLKAIIAKLNDPADDRDNVIAAPWTAADAAAVTTRSLATLPSGTHVVFTHWSVGGVGAASTHQQAGVYQGCSGVSGAALKTFLQDYPYTDSPSPGVLPSAQATS